MTGFLDFSEPPLSTLSAVERQRVRESVDVARFSQGQVLREPGKKWTHMYLVLRGVVEAQVQDEQGGSRIYGPSELVGPRDFVTGDTSRRFVSLEDTACLAVTADTVQGIVKENKAFRQAMSGEYSASLRLDGSRTDSDTFALARVKDATIRRAVVFPADTPALEGVRTIRRREADCILVRGERGIGMVTGTDLLKAAESDDGLGTPMGRIATWELLSAAPDEYLFDALIRMTRAHIERLVVLDGEDLIGIIDITDVLGLFSTQSHSLGIRIERAKSLEELREVSAATERLTRGLVDRGVSVARIVALLAALNARLMSRVFSMCIPAEILDRVCLIVMGSEGRGEQILKTDQDNAIVLEDGFDWPESGTYLKRFSAELEKLGYPPCPGNFMVSNPEWVMTVSQWRDKLDRWIRRADGDAMLDITVFSDAHPITGNIDLFYAVRDWFLERFQADSGFVSNFAHPVIRFSVPLNLFGRVRQGKRGIDVKKGGIFPLVHGVRSLALHAGIEETNTFRRIDTLVSRGALAPSMGEDLASALETLMMLRLRQQLDAVAIGRKPDNRVRMDGMSRLDREHLHRALTIVKSFQSSLARRLHLQR
jgi:CBS domain-containing protein